MTWNCVSPVRRAACCSARRHRFAAAQVQLRHHSPQRALADWRARSQDLQGRLSHAAQQQLSRTAHRLALARRGLDAVSPLATLSRGFAIVTGSDGALLTEAAAVMPGAEIEARLAHGVLSARVTGRK